MRSALNTHGTAGALPAWAASHASAWWTACAPICRCLAFPSARWSRRQTQRTPRSIRQPAPRPAAPSRPTSSCWPGCCARPRQRTGRRPLPPQTRRQVATLCMPILAGPWHACMRAGIPAIRHACLINVCMLIIPDHARHQGRARCAGQEPRDASCERMHACQTVPGPLKHKGSA